MSGSWRSSDLPNLNDGNHKVTSQPSDDYNCLAWAAGSDEKWWDPHPDYFWPDGLDRKASVEVFVQLYQKEGFEVCIGGLPEEGFEKIAIYARDSADGKKKTPTHAARLLDSGEWTSKLGPCEDITHATVDAVHGPRYGEVLFYMSRLKRDLKPSTKS